MPIDEQSQGDTVSARRVVVWTAQTILAVAVVLLIGRSVVRNWSAFAALDVELRIRPIWIGLAFVTVLATYALLIEAWRRVLAGWQQQVRFPAAARIWSLSNLGRYVPGKVWSLAALTLLARRAGVSGWSAAASALAMQALAIGTAAVVVAMSAPGVASPLSLGVAVLVAAGAITVLAVEPIAAPIAKLVRPDVDYRPLPLASVILAASVTLGSWLAYGVAFWFLALGLFVSPALPVGTAVGVFAAGYVVGLLMLFAPGGVGFRELVFVALLGPTLGSGGALALSIASRLLLTGTEISAALAALALSRGGRESR